MEIIWVTILSRQAADQARSAGDTGEVAADGGGNNAMSSASAVTAEVMVHVSNGEAAGHEATFHGSNRATLSGAVPQEGEGQVAAVGGSGGMGADDLDGSVGVEER